MQYIVDFLKSDFFTQGLGFVGMGAGLISFHMKRRSGILIFQTLCCTLFAVQLMILSNFSGAIINMIGIVRGVIYSLSEKYKWASSKIIPYVMITLFITTGIILLPIEGPVALLPSMAMTVQSIAQFSKDEMRIRFLSLFGSPLWIVYHVFGGSLGGWIGEIVMMISILSSMAYRKKSDTGAHSNED